ncbi:MAG: TetR/AcrR family transcriptional regulator, partial [Tissierellia bacterium]|nr:TetR/AcrR family transcriptional regulator [Tissierellia bacterium]
MSIREEILEVAKEEFLKEGFEKTSLRSIAKKCNISTGGIYGYFINKNEIFDSLVHEKVEQLFLMIHSFSDESTIVKGMPEDEVFENIRQILSTKTKKILPFFMQNREVFVLVFFKSKGTPYERTLNYLANSNSVRFINLCEWYLRKLDSVDKAILDQWGKSWVSSLAKG